MLRRLRRARGFTLIEVVIAISLLAGGVLAATSLVLAAARAGAAAQRISLAQLAARDKLEQLRALAFTSDAGLVPVTDWSADLTVTPPLPEGGVGLGLSPGDTIAANVAGYCDFLDADGRWLGRGTRAPAGAAWVRRWAVTAVAGLPDTLALRVIVVPVRWPDATAAADLAAARGVNGASLIALRSRRAR
jgi:prepilin-type N-terminal cleavage/methylation domain-containing protein